MRSKTRIEAVGSGSEHTVAFEMEKAAKAGDLEAVMINLPEPESQFALLMEAMKKDTGDQNVFQYEQGKVHYLQFCI